MDDDKLVELDEEMKERFYARFDPRTGNPLNAEARDYLLDIRLSNIERKLDTLLSVLAEFRPMLDRYKMASQANSRLGARKALKGSK